MIDLRTGIPGSGKTLSMVEALAKLLATWAKKPEDGRPIFVHNIKDLALAHAVMPLKVFEREDGKRSAIVRMVPDWDAMPDGSLVLIDECQDMFPPRSTQSETPAHIAWFNTHRHKGFDVWLVTQHPKLIDFSVRALVGKHQHFRRLFGGQRASTYEWDACSDNLSGLKDSVMSFYEFPKKAFQWYKSAEIHTKQSFKLPRWLLIPVVGVVIGVFTFPSAYSTLKNGISGKPISGVVAKPAESKPVTAVPVVAMVPPGQSSKPESMLEVAPAYPITDLTKVSAKYKPSGCVAMQNQCTCYGPKGSIVQVVESECKKAVTQIALLVDDSSSFVPSSPRVAQRFEDASPKPVKQDSGFNLPTSTVQGKYDVRYSMGPSGTVYAQ